VDLMHVLHRPHVPRLVSVSVAAAILTIVISLALASSLSSINQTGGNASTLVPHSAPASPITQQTTLPRWVSDPFASLLSRPLPRPWLIPHG
jgi:hypothetical protein